MPGLKSHAPWRGGLVVFARVGGGEVAIGKALGEDGFGLLAVQGEAFGLLVLFVPVEAQPAQALEDGLDAGFGVALDIGVVEAQDHGSVVVAGIEPIEDKGARAADVQEAGGRGGKTDAGSCCREGAESGIVNKLLSNHDASSAPHLREVTVRGSGLGRMRRLGGYGGGGCQTAWGAGTTFHSAKART